MKSPAPEEIAAFRMACRLSQRQAADRLPGITLRSLQAWEQGKRVCPPAKWFYIQQTLRQGAD